MGAIVDFLFDPSTGTQPAKSIIDQLITDATAGDAGKMQLYKFVQRGLEFLEQHGMPAVARDFFTGVRDDGRPYNILLVKNLTQHVPLLEYRINWQDTGAFRATFFEYQHPRTGEQVLLFVRAVVKQNTFDPEFERIAAESDVIYTDFIADPEKYITF